MPIQIESGWLNGNLIRRSRKTYKCGYWRGRSNGGFCSKLISPGDLYVEGEYVGETGRNGVLIRERYCPDCAGPEALAAIAKAEGR